MSMPEWAVEIFDSPKQWKEFIAGVRRALPAIDPAVKLHEDDGYANVTLDGVPLTVGLENVAHRCTVSGDVDGTLEVWLELIVESARSSAAHAKMTWEEAAPLLRVQLVNEQRRQSQPMVTRELAEDLYLALVLDTDISLLYVDEQGIARWGVDKETLFDRAMDNLYNAVQVEPADGDLPPTLQVYSSDDDYTAAATLVAIPDHVAEDSLGALVTFPTKFTCSFIALEGGLRSDAFGVLLEGAAELFANADGALTPNLYWWRDHELMKLPVLVVEGARTVLWPPELDGLLD